jgi:hypothetical protein
LEVFEESKGTEMSRAIITNGLWIRRVPWRKSGQWRADIFKSVLSDSRLKTARFLLKYGPDVLVSATELRQALEGARSHHVNNQIWGPFNIDPIERTINGQKVKMDVLPADSTLRRKKGRSRAT